MSPERNNPFTDDDFAEAEAEAAFLRDLDLLCRDDFDGGFDDEGFYAGQENVRPISDLEEVVFALEALNAKYQEGPLNQSDLFDELDELEEELRIVTDSYYERSMASQVEALLMRAKKASQAFRKPPAWSEKKPETPGAKELALLRKNGYYAVGIPHQIDELKQPYNRTLDIVMLVTELMQREGKPVCLLVANLATSTRTAEEARLIGLKDLIFYEALQDLLLEMAPPEGKPLRRLPVVLMSDIDQEPGFAEKRVAVGRLFDTNSNFREAVYSCVPTQLRHRKHHSKTYAQLEAMDNKAPLDVAKRRIPYVLDQISKVSSIGGKKWGHEREKPYDEATALAEQLLALDTTNRTEFECVKLAKSMGEIPYRAAAGLKDPKDIPGLLTSYGNNENYIDALKAFADKNRIPIDKINTMLALAEHALAKAQSETPPNPDKISHADASRALLLHLIKVMVRDYALSLVDEHTRLRAPTEALHEFLLSLMDKFVKQLSKYPKISEVERAEVKTAYMMQIERESYLSRANGAIVEDYVLMKRLNIFAVLTEAAPQSSIAEQSGKWIPFTAKGPTGARSYGYVPLIVNELLFGPGAPYQNQDNASDEMNCTETSGRWTIPYTMFETLLFSKQIPPKPITSSADLAPTLDRFINPPEKIRWRSFDEFIDAIEETPVETFYHAWLNQLTRAVVPNLEPLPPEFVQSEQAARIVQILKRPCFSKNFREYFLFILSGQ